MKHKLVKQWTRTPFLRMAEITRFSSWPVHHKESVAEHSWFVTMLAWGIARSVGLNDHDIDTTIKRAIVHDLDESLTGDFVRSFKHSNPLLKTAIRTNAESGMARAVIDFPHAVRDDISSHWTKAKYNDLPGAIVELSDLWSVIIYGRREFMLGNNYGLSIMRECEAWITARVWPTELMPIVKSITDEALLILESPQRAHEHSDEMTDPFFDMIRTNMKGGDGE